MLECWLASPCASRILTATAVVSSRVQQFCQVYTLFHFSPLQLPGLTTCPSLFLEGPYRCSSAGEHPTVTYFLHFGVLAWLFWVCLTYMMSPECPSQGESSCLFLCLKTASHYGVLADLELTMSTRLALNSQRFTSLCSRVLAFKGVTTMPGWVFLLLIFPCSINISRTLAWQCQLSLCGIESSVCLPRFTWLSPCFLALLLPSILIYFLRFSYR